MINFHLRMLKMHFQAANFQNISRGMPPDPLESRLGLQYIRLPAYSTMRTLLLQNLIKPLLNN